MAVKLFNHHKNISEYDIAVKAKISQNLVFNNLDKLHENNIVDYIKVSNTPLLTFTTPRQDANNLTLDSSLLSFQREEDEKKVSAMIDYVNTDHRCRTVILLEYFDEIYNQDCGICDYCLNKSKAEKNSFKEVRKLIIERLKIDSLHLSSLKNEFPELDEKSVIDAITEMIDVGEIAIDQEQRISLL